MFRHPKQLRPFGTFGSHALGSQTISTLTPNLVRSSPMSLYQVQKLLFTLARDEVAQRRFESERDALLGEFDLTDLERRALRDNDVGELYAMGVNPLLLIAYGSRAGLTWPQHIEALRRAEPRRKPEGA